MSAEGKLVRDRIPEIIRANGEEPVVYRADAEEYRRRLREKLGEEVGEFLAAGGEQAVEELADVLEVVFALAADLGVDREQLERVRAEKARERGAFDQRIVWTGIRWGDGKPPETALLQRELIPGKAGSALAR
ncbi:nucleoside triphosphate pyrophosphohydrolase [Kribbella qitaiheensis]|uniref:Nucleoside triphosphate pyrophosphohydrolase n=1 Tax=Kribbella qitaiheensis TaxID=1544730 RepID=A0A7G6WX64_9ACTN|nr:nucleoside triphosphate pyrophosphohydrolase [Kribbella qitaiheensis]QNE18579.1 nucleoside triphosphate pyrophosphohydrolase [Kribbella qitaiheensis]